MEETTETTRSLTSMATMSQMYWDRLVLGGETSEMYYLFSTPLCSLDPYNNGKPKSISYTNMYRGNQFPPPEMFTVERLIVSFSPSSRDFDVDKFREAYLLEFGIAEKLYWRGPLLRFPLRASAGELKPGETEEPWCVKIQPASIMPLQQFFVRLLGQPVTLRADIDLTVALDGQSLRGIQ